MYTSWTASLGTPPLSTAASIAVAPRRVADNLDRELLKEPIGVRTADTIKTSFRDGDVLYLLSTWAYYKKFELINYIYLSSHPQSFRDKNTKFSCNFIVNK